MPTLPRVETPRGPSTNISPANLPRVSIDKNVPVGNLGPKIQELGAAIGNLIERKAGVEDTIEANQLLAEHSIRSRELQSEILRTDLRDSEVVPEFDKRIKELNKEIISKAKSQNVKEALALNLPARTAGKINEIQGESDKRFSTNALAGYERALQSNTAAYVTASSDADRQDILGRHIASIDILAKMGIFDEGNREKEKQRFLRGVQLFDVERAIQHDPSSGVEAILNPSKFLEKYPNIKMEDLDNVFSKSIEAENRQHTLLERRRRAIQDQVISVMDEAAIRGKFSWDQLNTARDKGLISPESYRRIAGVIQHREDAGGVDDPSVKGELATRIRINPWSVSAGEILGKFGHGLSRNGMNELLDLKKVWQKSSQEDAEKTNPRLKGPLFSEGKTKIDMIVGKGSTISGIPMDDNTARRWGAAMDEYLEAVQRDPKRSQNDIADEVIKKWQGPARAAEIAPHKYRDESKTKTKGIDFQKLKRDLITEKDPKKKQELIDLIKKIEEAPE